MEPKYRADVKGHLREVMEDCVALMRGEIREADCFLMTAEDCETAQREYSQYLTQAELTRCFKMALKA